MPLWYKRPLENELFLELPMIGFPLLELIRVFMPLLSFDILELLLFPTRSTDVEYKYKKKNQYF